MISDLLLPGWNEKIATAIGTTQAVPFAPRCRSPISLAASTWSWTKPGPEKWSRPHSSRR